MSISVPLARRNISVALFARSHCVDEYAFDYQRIAKLTYGWRVRVRCPGCPNVVEVVRLAYTLIHNSDPGLDYKLILAIGRKNNGWRATND